MHIYSITSYNHLLYLFYHRLQSLIQFYYCRTNMIFINLNFLELKDICCPGELVLRWRWINLNAKISKDAGQGEIHVVELRCTKLVLDGEIYRFAVGLWIWVVCCCVFCNVLLVGCVCCTLLSPSPFTADYRFWSKVYIFCSLLLLLRSRFWSDWRFCTRHVESYVKIWRNWCGLVLVQEILSNFEDIREAAREFSKCQP